MKKGEKVNYDLLGKEGFTFHFSYKTEEVWKNGNKRIVINLQSQTITGIFEIGLEGTHEL